MILPIEKYQELLDYIEDLASTAERRDESTVPHEEVVKELNEMAS